MDRPPTGVRAANEPVSYEYLLRRVVFIGQIGAKSGPFFVGGPHYCSECGWAMSVCGL
jgi:hypothetical protein